MKKMFVIVFVLFSSAFFVSCAHSSGVSSTDCSGDFPNKHNGVCWSKKSPEKMNWSNANKYCANLVEDGSSDWRLPTISELRTLMQNCSAIETGGSCGVTDSCLSSSCRRKKIKACNGCSYDKSKSGKYSVFGDVGSLWSSSVRSDFTGFVWYLSFSSGLVNGGNIFSSRHHVRCVR